MDAVIRFIVCLLMMLTTASMVVSQQMHWTRFTEDTLYYGREYNPERVFLLLPGPAQTWDFRSLRAPYALSKRIFVTGEKKDEKQGILMHGNESEGILEMKGTASSIVQSIEQNPVCRDEKLHFQMIPAYKPFFKGVIGEDYTYNGRMIATFAWPKHKSCAWTPAQLPDSCRITYSIQEETTVDGAGTLYLPTELSSAYRQHIICRRAARVEIKYGIFWKDVTNQVPGIQLLTTKESYRYVAADSGMPMVEVVVNEYQQPRYIEFKTHPVATRIFSSEPDRPEIYAFPNPSFGLVRFQLTSLNDGKYKLKVFNILGSPIREMEVMVDDPRETVSMDLSDLQRGTYLFRLVDSNGKTIKTKRVVLIQS